MNIKYACFKALADENRVAILQLLYKKGELSVGEIVENFDLTQPTVSHHLKILATTGLVTYKKDGRIHKYKAIEQCPSTEKVCTVLENIQKGN